MSSADKVQEEDSKILSNFLDRTFFKSWSTQRDSKRPQYLGNFHSLELNTTAHCSQRCQYCYVQKYGKEYFPVGTSNPKQILSNTDLLIKWLHEHNYTPRIEIFSGEPLIQPLTFEIIDKLFEAQKEKPIGVSVGIPTNMDWLMIDKFRDRVIDVMQRGRTVNLPIHLSASVDGKFMEENRPHRSKQFQYSDEFYNRLFTFAARKGCGFHPMVHSNGIERWRDNFLWFQENFARYKISWANIYLLEVRNMEWTIDQTKELGRFLRFLIEWVAKNHPDFRTFPFNILAHPFVQVGRGIGCSIQSSIQLRLGDLSWAPCHRQRYDKFTSGQFVVENGKITGVKAKNLEFWLAIMSSEAKNFPQCETCLISTLCPHGCLGSQYETTGDAFSPIPTMCRMEHFKTFSILKGYQDVGYLNQIMQRLPEPRRMAITAVLDSEVYHEFTKHC